MDEATRRNQGLRYRILRMYTRGETTKNIAKEVGLPRKRVAQLAQKAIFDPVRIEGSQERRNKLFAERRLYQALNTYQGRNFGYDVDWM